MAPQPISVSDMSADELMEGVRDLATSATAVANYPPDFFSRDVIYAITIDVLVDTNILLRTQFDKSIHITDASRAFVELRRRGERLATTVQNLAEFWNVSTRPESANGHGLTTAETLTRLQYFETCVHNPAGVEPKLHDMEAVACHSRYSWKDGA